MDSSRPNPDKASCCTRPTHRSVQRIRHLAGIVACDFWSPLRTTSCTLTIRTSWTKYSRDLCRSLDFRIRCRHSLYHPCTAFAYPPVPYRTSRCKRPRGPNRTTSRKWACNPDMVAFGSPALTDTCFRRRGICGRAFACHCRR